MKKLIALILIAMFAFTGCSAKKEITEGFLNVTPSKLFQGDTKRLEPHLDMTTGCVNLKYKGEKKNLCLKYEIWENGKLKESNDILSSVVNDNTFDGEISISLKEIIGDDLNNPKVMKMRTVISDKKGYCASTRYIDRFDKKCSFGAHELFKEINASENEEVAVWGVTASKDSYFSGGDNIADEAKKADWGLVLSVYFK